MQEDIQLLQAALGYAFKDMRLLRRALTHRSFSAEHNERLEFLGDSVLNCAVSQMLYDQFPALDEGRLSRIRSHLVKQDCLAFLGRELKLDRALNLGAGELKSGAVIRDSIMADAVEAVFGAILLDSDYETSANAVRHLIKPLLDRTPVESLGKDPKTRLQEFLQARKLKLPRYAVLVEGGTSISPEFKVECHSEELDVSAQGVGHSRRLAEQEAAGHLLATLLESDYADPNHIKKG